MKLAFLGHAAGRLGKIAAAQPGVSVVVAADHDAVMAEVRVAVLDDGEPFGVIISGEFDGAVGFARTALDKNSRVLLAGVPTYDAAAWAELGRGSPDLLTLSRPVRFDPHLARTQAVVRAGTVGVPRTLDIAWSVDQEVDVMTGAAELVDVACWLLEGGPAAVYAVACGVAGSPLVKINLLLENGALATIEVAHETDGIPRRRDLHLLASDGEIVHRLGQDDLLWSNGRTEPLPAAASRDELSAMEFAAWHDGERPPDLLARGAALGWNLTAVAALAQSLSDGEMVPVEREAHRT